MHVDQPLPDPQASGVAHAAHARPLIQSLWIGDRLSAMEQLCMASFLQHGHTFHLFAYGDVQGVPDGVLLQDAATILPANRIFKYRQRNSYAGFANLFRYKLLWERGGCWVDADMICLKTLEPAAEHVFVAERARARQHRRGWLCRLLRRKPSCASTPEPAPNGGINNCFIQAPAGSTIMSYCYREADQKDTRKLEWGETGPRLLTEAVAHFALESCVARPEVYCPIDWWNWRKVIEANPPADALEGAQCVHLWNEMWRRNHVDKNGAFPASSLYEQLKQRYHVQP